MASLLNDRSQSAPLLQPDRQSQSGRIAASATACAQPKMQDQLRIDGDAGPCNFQKLLDDDNYDFAAGGQLFPGWRALAW